MSASLLFGKKGAKIGVLQLDATVSESHEYQNEVSEFPSENGDTITDNIRLLPEKITITGLVSNSPVFGLFDKVTDFLVGNSNEQEARRVSRDDTATRVESARDILLRIRGSIVNGQNKNPEIVDVVTGLRVYKNMVMESLRFDRNGRTGQALPFTANFTQIKTAEVATAQVEKPAEEVADKASPKTQKGKQKPTETNPEATKKVGLVKSIYNGLTSNLDL